jgi:hypothetical protein
MKEDQVDVYITFYKYVMCQSWSYFGNKNIDGRYNLSCW